MCIYYTPMSIYCYLFSSFKFEVSQVPNGQKQALVNALKICLLPHPVTSMQTPQREFAGAKVLLFFEICKKICTFDADFLCYV